MCQFAHLLQVLEDGQFGRNLHLRSQDLFHEFGRLVEFEAQMGYLLIPEEVLEVVDRCLGVAEELDLLSLLRVELVDGVQLLEVLHGLGVDMLAKVFGLETLALFSSRALVEYFFRNLQDHSFVPSLGALTFLKVVLPIFREEILLRLVPSAELFLMRGGKLDLRGNGVHLVGRIFLLIQAFAGGDGLDEVWLEGVSGGVAKVNHFLGYFEGVVEQVALVDLVALLDFVEPAIIHRLLD